MTARAAPFHWPYYDHRNMAEVMADEEAQRRKGWRERQRLERKKP